MKSPVSQTQRKEQGRGWAISLPSWSFLSSGEERAKIIKIMWVGQMNGGGSEVVGRSGDRGQLIHCHNDSALTLSLMQVS